ncbi:hypothetical protein CHISP_3497 [Chitinispirillum alkaliphilum]|nr:hypothetical protein CHISP_3497 [Chitinispirillum alkaliphilum]
MQSIFPYQKISNLSRQGTAKFKAADGQPKSSSYHNFFRQEQMTGFLIFGLMGII